MVMVLVRIRMRIEGSEIRDEDGAGSGPHQGTSPHCPKGGKRRGDASRWRMGRWHVLAFQNQYVGERSPENEHELARSS